MARGHWVTIHDLANLRPDEVARSHEIGAQTNLRVCRDSLEVVPVVPYPAPESIWAPPETCEASAKAAR